jgi:hypothetical protein
LLKILRKPLIKGAKVLIVREGASLGKPLALSRNKREIVCQERISRTQNLKVGGIILMTIHLM